TGPSQDQPPYTLLDSQVQRSLQIAQTNDVGNVPGPKIVNPLDTRLFLMGGQTLPGAKQSCIVAADVLLCANASVSIPVSRVNERQAACARATFTEDKSTSRRTLASNLANTQPDRKLADRRSQLHPLDHTVGLA